MEFYENFPFVKIDKEYYKQYLEENRNKEFKKEKNFIHNNSLYLQNHSNEKNYLRAIKQ